MKRPGSLIIAPAFLLVGPMAALMAIRVALMLGHPSDFAPLTWRETLQALARGTKFDASIALAVLALPIAMLLVPWRRLAWRRTWGWAGFAGFVLLVLLAVGDAIYFGVVGRHVGPEAAALPAEAPRLARLAVAEHAGALALFAVAAFAGGWGWKRVLDRESRPASWRAWLILAAFVPLAIIGIRGGVQSKPMGVVNAFDGVSRPAGLLALSGPYAILQGVVALRPVPSRFMSEQDAIAIARAHLASPRETFLDDRYPLLRHRTAEKKETPPNVVVLLLEGWSPLAVDAQRREMGLAPLGTTPVFDALAAQGMLFTNFYANGQRSAESFSSLFAGVPALPGIRYLGLGMEQNHMPYIGTLAKENGVRTTLFVRGALRDSFRLDAVSNLAGFDRYLGFEDLEKADGRGRDHPWGASDERTFDRAIAELKDAPEPFLAFVFTLSTHRPWLDPGEQWHVFPHDTDEHRYLNDIRYADQQIGRFMEAARADGWYDRTLFLLVSDHYPPLGDRGALDVPARHRVPLLIVGPGIAPAVRPEPGSHVDLLPTIMDLAGWSGSHASLGRSLLERDPATAAAGPLVTGDLLTWIDAHGSISHDLRTRVSATGDDASAAEREKLLLALTQLALEGLKTNRIAPEPTAP